MSDLSPETPKTRRRPAPRPTPETGWRDILAHAFAEFLITKPVDFADGVRRVLVMGFLVFLSGGGFIVARHPDLAGILNPTPVEERSILQRMAENPAIRSLVVAELETWFYTNRPHGLMLVSWEELRSMTGVWVNPARGLEGRKGAHTIPPDTRELVGPFIFGECAMMPSRDMPGKTMIACPVNTEFDVWGFVAAIVDPNEVDINATLKSVNALTYRLTRLFY